MAKIKRTSNVNKSTRVIKQSSVTTVTKPINKIYQKRLLMKQRRINALSEERNSMEDKNRELLENLKTEKMLTSNLRKDNFQLQRLYHESVISLNSYKVKQNELIQALSMGIREYDAVFPHMVALSESVASNKVRLSNMLNSLRSSEHYFPKQFIDSGRENDSPKKNANPMKHRVGPMVRGLLITKPKIILDRVMLPQPQEQEQVNGNLNHIEVNNQLTPIPEENDREENIDLRGIAVRPRHKLGKSWRLRRQEKLERDRERDRGKESQQQVAYSGDSSDTESNSAAMEAVVRFRDVSRLLQNSSLLKVDNTRTGDGDGGGGSIVSRQSKNESRLLTANMKRAAEDPLEGSSWMFTNNVNHHNSFRHSHSGGRNTSLYKSDSSDDENILHTQKNDSSLSIKNTLVHPPNETYTIPQKNIPSTPETSNDTTGSPAEPDSTNNIDDQHFSFNGSSFENDFRNSGSSSTSANRSSLRTINDYNIENKSQTVPRISINTNVLTVRLSKVPELSTLNNNCVLSSNKRHSSFCNNCSPMNNSPEVVGKRVRKPKKQLYPGEEEDCEPSPKNKISKPAKVSIGRKSIGKKKKSNFDKRSDKNAVNNTKSTTIAAIEPCNSLKKTTNNIKESGSGKNVKSKNSLSKNLNSTSISNGGHNSLGFSKKSMNNIKEGTIGADKKQNSKKSSVKKSSLFSGVNSSISNGHHQSIGNEDSTIRPKRSKTNVCYKESPLHLKQRRP